MSKKLLALSLVAAAAALPQLASATITSSTITFEGLADETAMATAPLATAYNDTAHFHTTFSGGGATRTSKDIGGVGLFPGVLGPDITDPADVHSEVLRATAADILFSVADGVTELTFSYAAKFGFSVSADGVDAGAFGATDNLDCPASPVLGVGTYNLCDWTTVTLSFASAVHSFVFSGGTAGAGFILFDDLIFSRPDAPASGVPEPTTYSLIGLGLVGALASRRRKQ
ncbi:MAG: PEP-CTERM sorting domain-containing protein [Burkholderiales bacterium]|nr:PEP-CTERM sorting domain-containing protein [Burkholderiales bacterium]